jgi:hypothetical protein
MFYTSISGWFTGNTTEEKNIVGQVIASLFFPLKQNVRFTNGFFVVSWRV